MADAEGRPDRIETLLGDLILTVGTLKSYFGFGMELDRLKEQLAGRQGND